jgi:hypothetical protein
MKKKLNEILEFLGEGYSIKTIDLENVIYFKISDLFDIEISGLNNSRRSFDATIFVWELKPGLKTIETIQGINSKEKLKEKLDEVIEKYK